MKIFFTIIIVLFLKTSALSQSPSTSIENTQPFILGVIDEIHSTELGEKRILNIYLPEGYVRNDSIDYPVIYVLDGAADEDFIHIAGLIQFNNFPWVNRTPPSIVVGIANVDRKRDFSWPSTNPEDVAAHPTTGHSDKFIAFIEKELQPYIESKYNGTGTRTILGQSLGGLLAAEILCKKPGMFDQYIIVSPSLWWDNGSLLNQPFEILEKNTISEKKIYIGVGKEGLVPGSVPRVMEVDANLFADKIANLNNKLVKVYFDYLPGENHVSILHLAASNAFQYLYPVLEE